MEAEGKAELAESPQTFERVQFIAIAAGATFVILSSLKAGIDAETITWRNRLQRHEDPTSFDRGLTDSGPAARRTLVACTTYSSAIYQKSQSVWLLIFTLSKPVHRNFYR